VEAQAKLAAAFFAGRYALPTAEAQAEVVAAARQAAVDRWGPVKRPMMRIDFDAYLDDTAAEIRQGERRAAAGAETFVPIVAALPAAPAAMVA
jgi:hypothetical protein